MRTITQLLLFLTLAGFLSAEEKPSLQFEKTDYIFRWHKNTLSEFTPKGQEDLKTWKDMISIIKVTAITTEDGLATAANGLLANYEENKAHLFSTDSTPKTDTKPAEHLIAAVFVTQTYMEIVFNRLVLIDGVGHIIIYSHRMYGKGKGEAVSEWTKTNHERITKSLMELPVKDLPELLKKTSQVKVPAP